MLPFVFSYKRSPVNHVNEIYSPCNSSTLSIVVVISPSMKMIPYSNLYTWCVRLPDTPKQIQRQ